VPAQPSGQIGPAGLAAQRPTTHAVWRHGRGVMRCWRKQGAAVQTRRSATGRAISGGDVGQNSRGNGGGVAGIT
jgi:hypothetical protein